MNSKDLIRALERWLGLAFDDGQPSPLQAFDKPGKVTVPYPKKDLHPKTVRAILKAAGL